MASVNPDGLFLLVLAIVKIAGRLHAVPDEISNYQFKLQMTLSLLNDVNSTRHSTFCSRAIEARIDRDLREIESKLKDVQKSLGRRTRNKSSNQKIAWTERIVWHFVHSHVANTNDNIVNFCKDRLAGIETMLKAENQERPRRLQRFFEELETQTTLASLRRVEKNGRLYSGCGVQMSRSQGAPDSSPLL